MYDILVDGVQSNLNSSRLHTGAASFTTAEILSSVLCLGSGWRPSYLDLGAATGCGGFLTMLPAPSPHFAEEPRPWARGGKSRATFVRPV